MKLEMRIFNNFFPVIRDVAIRMTMIILILHKEPQKVRDHERTVKSVCCHEGPGAVQVEPV